MINHSSLYKQQRTEHSPVSRHTICGEDPRHMELQYSQVEEGSVTLPEYLPRRPLALVIVSRMCVLQERSLVMVTPNSRSMYSSDSPCSTSCGERGLLFLNLDTTITLTLLIFHVPQSTHRSRSAATAATSEIIWDVIHESLSLTVSLIVKLNNKIIIIIRECASTL